MQDAEERREDREFHAAEGRGPAGTTAKPAAQARQGVGSGRVTLVLVVGIVLVALGFAVSYMGAV